LKQLNARLLRSRATLRPMAADDRVVCPACFVILPPVKPEVVEVHCPRCHHVWDPADELQQTVEQTPMAKRRSSRPG